METKEPTCASCQHCSLDGRYCHNWRCPIEPTASCPQHCRFSAIHAQTAAEVRRETSRHNRHTNL